MYLFNCRCCYNIILLQSPCLSRWLQVYGMYLCLYFCTVSSETSAAAATSPSVSVQSETANESMQLPLFIMLNMPCSYGTAQKAILQLLMSYAWSSNKFVSVTLCQVNLLNYNITLQNLIMDSVHVLMPQLLCTAANISYVSQWFKAFISSFQSLVLADYTNLNKSIKGKKDVLIFKGSCSVHDPGFNNQYVCNFDKGKCSAIQSLDKHKWMLQYDARLHNSQLLRKITFFHESIHSS